MLLRNLIYAPFSIFGIIGIVFGIFDLVRKDRPAKVWWIIAMIFFPLGWAIYLILSFTMLKDQQPAQIDANTNVTQPPLPSPDGQQFYNSAPQAPQAPAPYLQVAAASGVRGVFRTFKIIGIVLASIALVSGVVMVGFFILLMLAFSSYGSNK